MHLSSLAVVAALTASVYISTTLATSNDTCLAVGKYCDDDSQCCSDACTWKADCTEKYCVAIDNILDLEELRRAYTVLGRSGFTIMDCDELRPLPTQPAVIRKDDGKCKEGTQ
ncbi:hypothetical protein EV424DRAFT_1551980 [Suillus variegatus]|nr:hypothetical protein EV424DRAFT_1551980 [Suillus variegatus]